MLQLVFHLSDPSIESGLKGTVRVTNTNPKTFLQWMSLINLSVWIARRWSRQSVTGTYTIWPRFFTSTLGYAALSRVSRKKQTSKLDYAAADDRAALLYIRNVRSIQRQLFIIDFSRRPCPIGSAGNWCLQSSLERNAVLIAVRCTTECEKKLTV